MRINLGGGDAGVAKQARDGEEVDALTNLQAGEGMASRMEGEALSCYPNLLQPSAMVSVQAGAGQGGKV